MRAEARIWALGLALLGGCDEAFSGGGVATVTPMFATITARDLRALGPEESLTVELDGAYPTVFEFDGRDGGIDFDRIEIATPEASPMAMSLWLARQVPTSGVDFGGLPSARFRLANDRMAASLGLAEPDPAEAEGCAPIEVVELEALVAVVFVADSGC